MNICQAWERKVVASELYFAGDDELLRAVIRHQLFLVADDKYSAL